MQKVALLQEPPQQISFQGGTLGPGESGITPTKGAQVKFLSPISVDDHMVPQCALSPTSSHFVPGYREDLNNAGIFSSGAGIPTNGQNESRNFGSENQSLVAGIGQSQNLHQRAAALILSGSSLTQNFKQATQLLKRGDTQNFKSNNLIPTQFVPTAEDDEHNSARGGILSEDGTQMVSDIKQRLPQTPNFISSKTPLRIDLANQTILPPLPQSRASTVNNQPKLENGQTAPRSIFHAMRKSHQDQTKEEIIEQLLEVEEQNRLLWKQMNTGQIPPGGHDIISVGSLDNGFARPIRKRDQDQGIKEISLSNGGHGGNSANMSQIIEERDNEEDFASTSQALGVGGNLLTSSANRNNKQKGGTSSQGNTNRTLTAEDQPVKLRQRATTVVENKGGISNSEQREQEQPIVENHFILRRQTFNDPVSKDFDSLVERKSLNQSLLSKSSFHKKKVPEKGIQENHQTYVSLNSNDGELLDQGYPEIASHVHIVNQASSLQERRVLEKSFFDHIRQTQPSTEDDTNVFLVDVEWVRSWIAYLEGKSEFLPDAIQNEGLHDKYFKRQATISVSVDFYFMTEKLWVFLHMLYGGGPILRKNQIIQKQPPPEISQRQGVDIQQKVIHSRQRSVGVNINKQVESIMDHQGGDQGKHHQTLAQILSQGLTGPTPIQHQTINSENQSLNQTTLGASKFVGGNKTQHLDLTAGSFYDFNAPGMNNFLGASAANHSQILTPENNSSVTMTTFNNQAQAFAAGQTSSNLFRNIGRKEEEKEPLPFQELTGNHDTANLMTNQFANIKQMMNLPHKISTNKRNHHSILPTNQGKQQIVRDKKVGDKDNAQQSKKHGTHNRSSTNHRRSFLKNISDTLRRSDDHEPRVVGLDNPNNYCYMNAVMQMLISVKELRKYFFNKEFRNIAYTTHFQQKSLSLGVAKLFKEMLTLEEEYEQLKPSFFHRLLEHRFKPELQHDAHEFLMYVLGQLQDELNPGPQTEVSRRFSMTSSTSSGFWKNYQRAHPSIIDQLFVGQFQQTIQCKQCGNRSTSSSPFKDISLEMTKSVQQSIAQFLAIENLESEEKYSCVVCQTLTNAKIKKKFIMMPQYLVLQVKRFDGLYRKVRDAIDYPEQLDMESLCAPHYPPLGSYKLIGLILHHGSTIEKGHYFAITQRPGDGRWWLCNDKEIIELSDVQDVLSCQKKVYLLLYQKINMPSTSPI